jgi:NitT/TauT family transport system permease protein
MTSDALGGGRPTAFWRHPWIADRAPVVVVVAALIAIWYVAAIAMNMALVRDAFEREETAYSFANLIEGTLNAERPLARRRTRSPPSSWTPCSTIRRIRRAVSSITAS